MALSGPLPLPLCFSYKSATNKNVQAQRPALLPPSFRDAFIFTKVSRLLRGHCAESLIPTQVAGVLPVLTFKPLIFTIMHFQAAAACPGFQRPLVERTGVCVSLCAQQTHEPGEPRSAYAGTNCIL